VAQTLHKQHICYCAAYSVLLLLPMMLLLLLLLLPPLLW
jgi:hypothetical protein